MRHYEFFVYILRCSDDSYYVGVTNNLVRRLKEHEDGTAVTCYTYRRRPIALVHSEWYQYVNDAIAREKQLKRWTRAKKEALIRGDIEALKKHAVAYRDRGHGSAGSP